MPGIPKSHLVTCPFCRATLEVESVSGKITGQWEKTGPASSKKKFSDALKKLEESKKKSDDFFSCAADRLKEKKEKTDKLFGEQLKKVKEEGLDEPPPSPFDFD